MTFPERLELLLKQKKMTQKELAEYLDIRRPSISDWKKDGIIPRADIAIKMAKILGVSVEYLIDGEDPAKPDTGDVIRQTEKLLDDLKKL